MAISKELVTASRNASDKYGIPADVILGFAGLETSYGSAGVGKSKNNAFGLMTYSGTAMSFDSITDSVEYFAKLVTGNLDGNQSKKYGNAVKNAVTPEDWINAIVNAGYNSEYAEGVYTNKVMSIIRRDSSLYGLYGTNIDTTKTPNTSNNLKWWGDIVLVVVCIIILVGGVVFLGLSVTSTTVGDKTVSKISKKIKGGSE